ncbi:PA3496 family putative envelope integrity protein [Aliamphritea hakodatensis]|uniref:PA3496 family putative envelope integrity protein n=1 Tax=Aliamphritea hakodatensis TaxID=2895352 RepID=UPI0022FD8A17|nr:hypothetical protein [Aliamphritea hakodatensis]
MQLRKSQDLNELQTEIFDLMVGIEEEEQQARQKVASKRSLLARRAIEDHREQKALVSEIDDEHWFDDL